MIMDIKITEKQRERILKLLSNRNPQEVFKLLGGVDNFLKILNNDFKEFYEITGYIPYTIDNLNGGRMLIDKILIDSLNLEDRQHWSNGEKQLGHFIFGTKNGPKYTFNARATGKAINNSNGQEFMSVAGMCVDLGLGFGYGDLKEKEKLGKRAQSQIYKQIIEKYNLDSYNGY
jgi:hypothetical protein